MASRVFTGTAINHRDLLFKVMGHLTDNVLGTEKWVVEDYLEDIITDELYLRGPGLSATDRIHINIKAIQNDGKDVYNWEVTGSVAYNPLNSFVIQPGASPIGHLCLWDSIIPYWLIANGRRFILIAKVSTTYQTLYAGFYLPYATSSEMPYPSAMMTSSGNNLPELRWSTGTYQIGSFWDPVEGSSYVRHWNGSWIEIANFEYRSDLVRVERTVGNVWPWEKDYGIGINKDGNYGLLPAVIHSSYGEGNALGELEGVFFVSGFSEGSEDIITIGGDTYLVVQSAYRTSRRDYAAIKLG